MCEDSYFHVHLIFIFKVSKILNLYKSMLLEHSLIETPDDLEKNIFAFSRQTYRKYLLKVKMLLKWRCRRDWSRIYKDIKKNFENYCNK